MYAGLIKRCLMSVIAGESHLNVVRGSGCGEIAISVLFHGISCALKESSQKSRVQDFEEESFFSYLSKDLLLLCHDQHLDARYVIQICNILSEAFEGPLRCTIRNSISSLRAGSNHLSQVSEILTFWKFNYIRADEGINFIMEEFMFLDREEKCEIGLAHLSFTQFWNSMFEVLEFSRLLLRLV